MEGGRDLTCPAPPAAPRSAPSLPLPRPFLPQLPPAALPSQPPAAAIGTSPLRAGKSREAGLRTAQCRKSFPCFLQTHPFSTKQGAVSTVHLDPLSLQGEHLAVKGCQEDRNKVQESWPSSSRESDCVICSSGSRISSNFSWMRSSSLENDLFIRAQLWERVSSFPGLLGYPLFQLPGGLEKGGKTLQTAYWILGCPSLHPPQTMEEKESSPSLRWGKRKLWVAVAAMEFSAILILLAGLAHFAAHHERATETENRGEGSSSSSNSSSLASLGRVNRTLQAAVKRWELCQNHTRALEANTSSLSSEMTQIKTHLRLKEFKIKGLEDEVVLLKNWTQMLQDVKKHQEEIIAHLQQQQRRLPASSGIPPYGDLTSLGLTMAVILLL